MKKEWEEGGGGATEEREGRRVVSPIHFSLSGDDGDQWS